MFYPLLFCNWRRKLKETFVLMYKNTSYNNLKNNKRVFVTWLHYFKVVIRLTSLIKLFSLLINCIKCQIITVSTHRKFLSGAAPCFLQVLFLSCHSTVGSSHLSRLKFAYLCLYFVSPIGTFDCNSWTFKVFELSFCDKSWWYIHFWSYIFSF